DTQFGDGARPPLATRASLVAEATQVVTLVAEEVAIARDVKPGGAVTEGRLVLHPLDGALGAGAEMMIHQVVPQLAGTASQPARPDVRCRAHEQPGGIECGRAEKNDARLVVR